MIERYHTGGGCMALRITENDAPGTYAYVTDADGSAIPADPESDAMMIGTYREDADEAFTMATLEGRAGLLKWYVDNVGYDPDVDNGKPLPIEELIDNVASMMLLHTFANQPARMPSPR